MARRNPRIKRANEETEFTPEQLQELVKCRKDPVYFAKNYVMIQHPKKGAIPFALYDYQIEMMKAFRENRYNIILSARQTGKCLTHNTTVTTIDKKSINILKKVVLWLIDMKQYNEIFKKV